MSSETTKPKFRGEPVDEDKPRVKNVQVIRYEDGGKDPTVEQLKQHLQKIQDENKALQLRILGVNELARLLQDRTEVTEVLQEKNKRLEVAVVRLENRCSNFERKLRAQGGAVVGPKPGQSPFIPGPSRQILEALMKENSELKKTLNNLTKKGATGYLEAVKTTQLEEVIDNQTQEIEFLKSQIQSLTTSGLGTEEDRSSSEVSLGLGSSFNSSASVESGPLKQQLIKLRNALRVKDRFNSLLCQKVAEFEDRVKQLQSDAQPDGNESSVSAESGGGGHVMQDTTTHDADPYSGQIQRTTQVQESTEYHDLQVLKKKLEEQKAKFEQVIDDQGKTLQKERDERMQLVSRMGEIEKELKTSKSELDSLNSRCEDLSTYNQTLVEEKSQLTKMLSDAEQKISGSESWTRVQQLEQELREHQKLSQDQVKEHSDAVQEKEKEINNLRLMLEDAQYKYVISDSKLGTIENEKKQEIEDLKDKVEDLERDVDAWRGENQELRQRNIEMHHQLSHLRASTRYPSSSSSHMHTRPGGIPGCGPVLKVATHSGPIEGIRDGKPPLGEQRRAYSQQLPGHCGENIIENPIRQEIQLISRFPEDPPVTTSAQKPSSLNIHSSRYPPTHASYSHAMTAPSPSQFIGGNIAGIQNTPTTPLAPNQPTRSHSPMHPPHPRYTTPFHTTAAGSIYYTRQPSTTASTVASYYPQSTPKPVYAPGYSPSGTNVPSMPSMGGSSGYGSIVSGPSSDFMPQGQSLSPHLHKQVSKESAYGSMGYASGLGQTSLSPHSPHHVYDHRQYSPQGYHHTERRSSSPLPHDYNYQQHQ